MFVFLSCWEPGVLQIPCRSRSRDDKAESAPKPLAMNWVSVGLHQMNLSPDVFREGLREPLAPGCRNLSLWFALLCVVVVVVVCLFSRSFSIVLGLTKVVVTGCSGSGAPVMVLSSIIGQANVKELAAAEKHVTRAHFTFYTERQPLFCGHLVKFHDFNKGGDTAISIIEHQSRSLLYRHCIFEDCLAWCVRTFLFFTLTVCDLKLGAGELTRSQTPTSGHCRQLGKERHSRPFSGFHARQCKPKVNRFHAVVCLFLGILQRRSLCVWLHMQGIFPGLGLLMLQSLSV